MGWLRLSLAEAEMEKSPRGRRQHTNFLKNCMKLGKFWYFGPWGGRRTGGAPLGSTTAYPPPPMSKEILGQSVKCHADVMIRKFIPGYLEGIKRSHVRVWGTKMIHTYAENTPKNTEPGTFDHWHQLCLVCNLSLKKRTNCLNSFHTWSKYTVREGNEQ